MMPGFLFLSELSFLKGFNCKDLHEGAATLYSLCAHSHIPLWYHVIHTGAKLTALGVPFEILTSCLKCFILIILITRATDYKRSSRNHVKPAWQENVIHDFVCLYWYFHTVYFTLPWLCMYFLNTQNFPTQLPIHLKALCCKAHPSQ